VHSLDGVKPTNWSNDKIEVQPLRGGSPFRQAVYAAERQSAAEMLRNKIRPVKSTPGIHRLTVSARS